MCGPTLLYHIYAGKDSVQAQVSNSPQCSICHVDSRHMLNPGMRAPTKRHLRKNRGVCWLLLFAKIAALRHTYKKDQKGISVIKERRQHNRSKACEENQNTEILTTRQ